MVSCAPVGNRRRRVTNPPQVPNLPHESIQSVAYNPTGMKRRRFFQTLIAAPAAPALLAQQVAAPPSPANRPPTEDPKIETVATDQAAEPVLRFFTAPQFAALRRLSGILMPPLNGSPGALDAGAAEFLDFLLGESPSDRQQVYRAGLDALNAQARKQHGKLFTEVDAAQAEALLAALRQPWQYDPPADPLAHFLITARQDVRTATMNSREWNAAGAQSGGRRMGGTGLYWNTI
jgi:Gluconate 2-dehydrogenase subunit 3